MIVLEGRNDRERLDELLAAGEQTHLDYKAVLDLSQAKDKLKWLRRVLVGLATTNTELRPGPPL
jgi:5S rRNA maturation endonuclease (ribonuclease M5)